MLKNFYYTNITFNQQEHGPGLVVKGEVTNRSGRQWSAVAFRIILFIKTIPIGNATFTINGFCNGQTRRFEKQIGELEHSKVAKDITRCEVYAESGY